MLQLGLSLSIYLFYLLEVYINTIELEFGAVAVQIT